MLSHRGQKRAFTVTHLVLLLSACALIASAVLFTTSYLKTQTDDIPNEFVPVKVTCQVTEDEPVDGATKKNVCIQNTGDITAYIRATVVFNWVKVDSTAPDTQPQGDIVLAKAPKENVDYAILWGDTSWVRGQDGFWYYTQAVPSTETTAPLIRSVVCGNTVPAGYELQVQVLATAIQADPSRVVEETWGVMVSDSNSTLTPAQ